MPLASLATKSTPSPAPPSRIPFYCSRQCPVRTLHSAAAASTRPICRITGFMGARHRIRTHSRGALDPDREYWDVVGRGPRSACCTPGRYVVTGSRDCQPARKRRCSRCQRVCCCPRSSTLSREPSLSAVIVGSYAQRQRETLNSAVLRINVVWSIRRCENFSDKIQIFKETAGYFSSNFFGQLWAEFNLKYLKISR